MPEWWRSHDPGSCTLSVHGVPASLRRVLARASMTRWRIVSEVWTIVADMSARLGVCTSMRMSIRSSSGPDKRARYRLLLMDEHVQRRPPLPPPHGHGFDAITSWNEAG